MMKSELLSCRPIGPFPHDDLAAANRAFAGATPCHLRQSWLDTAEADFAPGVVRTGWRGGSLLVFAELTDADIFTRAMSDNEHFWELGDTFEMFLRPEGQTAYTELHVAPNNRHLQLRFAGPEALAQSRQANSFKDVLLSGPVFTSTTWVEPAAQRWCVLAEIPAGSVCDTPQPPAGTRWHFSFSRYDYTRGRSEPVISSTSALTLPDFHRQQDWGALQFEP